MIVLLKQMIPNILHGYIELYRLKFFVKSPDRWSLSVAGVVSQFQVGLSTQKGVAANNAIMV